MGLVAVFTDFILGYALFGKIGGNDEKNRFGSLIDACS